MAAVEGGLEFSRGPTALFWANGVPAYLLHIQTFGPQKILQFPPTERTGNLDESILSARQPIQGFVVSSTLPQPSQAPARQYRRIYLPTYLFSSPKRVQPSPFRAHTLQAKLAITLAAGTRNKPAGRRRWVVPATTC